ncbi:transcription factor ATOH8 [Ambystoma mexicanum]|uniref:transcription factor ATOH8 n=1 Tax=Ambystoma mexicanum TaxID=8296 RepID=UPI0037E7232B
MRNLQMMEQAAWGSLVKEVNGIKKLKRKDKEGMKIHGLKRCKVTSSLKAPQPAGKGPLQDRPSTSDEEAPHFRGVGASSRTDAAAVAMDLRSGAFPAGAAVPPHPPSQRREPFPSQALLHGFEHRAFADQQQALPSRIVFCTQRPPEGPYAPVSHQHQVVYSPPSSDPSISPRRGGGEPTAGAPSEVRAIQQTRRLLANARERTRVHTISAAFEALRKQVPCYSYGQKLSKLAILRIACNYILSLAKLADLDYTVDHSSMSFAECVEQCTRTLQAEGRSKKRKE